MATSPFRVKALYDYVSQEEDDLKFKGDQIITVTDEEDADWYYGEYEDESGSKQEGLFPKNFVKIFEPETPPRPQRTARNKKVVEPPALNDEPTTTESIALSSAEEIGSRPQRDMHNAESSQMQAQSADQKPVNELAMSSPPYAASLKPSAAPKSGHPAVTEKPASNAFRDRINAFNKPAAPPVAPAKPGGLGSSGGTGFVKKAFVAPPPSKNAYVAPPRETPQKVYRREEEPDLIQNEVSVVDEATSAPFATAPLESEDDQPKPTSLKERIALLQKQQMEQAARHAEGNQKKEKSKRPLKAAEAEQAFKSEEDLEGEPLDKIGSAETSGKRSMDVAPGRPGSRDETPVESPVVALPRETLSGANDVNDADQSGALDIEESEDASTGWGRSESIPTQPSSLPAPALPNSSTQFPKPGHQGLRERDEDSEEDDQEDVDPEVRRRLEIRERMAKMSGGMGMAGMFGPSRGMPSRSSAKKHSASSERKDSATSTHTVDTPASKASPVPLMPMPGLQKVQSPEQLEPTTEVEQEKEEQPRHATQERDPEDLPDIEDVEGGPIPPPARRSIERNAPSEKPQGRAVPPPPPPASSERPVPPPPTASRPVPPPPPPRQAMSHSEGSESDDELSSHDRKATDPDSSRPTSKEGHSQNIDGAHPISQRHQVPSSQPAERAPKTETSPGSTHDPPAPSRMAPPIPPLPAAPHNRAPPPPPPSAAPPARSPPADRPRPLHPATLQHDDNDEEITEYDGDYDTDIASGAAHKDALKAHPRTSSLEDASITQDPSLDHSELPSAGHPPKFPPRAVPPPPPPQSAQSKRQSSDMPRGAPPPRPPPKQVNDDEDDEYDPYRYTTPARGLSSSRRENPQLPRTPTVEEPEPSYSPSPPRHRRTLSANHPAAYHPSSPSMSIPGSANPRQSSDMQRTSTTIRRSAEISRPSGEHFMAGDIDLNQTSRWWTQPNAPPPVFQNRRDVLFEVEENSTIRRGGKKSITKDVYVLYMDYSQTVITAHFEAADPETATLLEQRHEPPPRTLRQDQLEDNYYRFGARIADIAKSREGSTIDDGSPAALPLELISTLPDALHPVGVRAYGALVYANLANATVLQHDEIRPGDIVTFRNAKFGGHRGPVKSKYNIEVGKPDHVGVVLDWDGTKKKLRVWDQGRESKKVKVESFKFGDMKSGEVKVWRVMGRGWVGWEGTN